MKTLNRVDNWNGTGFRCYVNAEDPGDIFPSITTVRSIIVPPKLKKVISERSHKENVDTLKTTADIGTRRDDIFTAIMRGEEIKISPEEEPYVKAFRDMVERHQIEPVHTQITVYSDVLGIAGTADLVGRFTHCGDARCCGPVPKEEYDHRLCVMDYKTGFYGKGAGVQQMFYSKAGEEMGLWKDAGVVGLKLPRSSPVYKCLPTGHLDYVWAGALANIQSFRYEMFSTFFDFKTNKPLWSHVNKVAWEEWADYLNKRNFDDSLNCDGIGGVQIWRGIGGQ